MKGFIRGAFVALLIIAVASAAHVGGTEREPESASYSNSREKVQITMESGASASSDSSQASQASAEGGKSQNNIVINMAAPKKDDAEGDEQPPCTSNCDAEVSNAPQITGPMHYSQPLGDLEGQYAPVRGSQTEATPTAWTSPLDTTESALPGLPAPDANEARADAAAVPAGTNVDTPVVNAARSSQLDQLKNALQAKRAQAGMDHKGQLNANIAAAQDQLQNIAKIQRELRYQYSELELKHAGLRGQVQEAQLELAKLNAERPSFPTTARDIEALRPSLQQDKDFKVLGQPKDKLEEQQAEKNDSIIMQLLHHIVDKLDGKIPKDEKDESKETPIEKKEEEAAKPQQEQKAE